MDPPQHQPAFLPFLTSVAAGGVPSVVFNAAPSFPPAQIVPEAPQNHVANPSPAPALNHPSYADMIYAAITALKEREGSSKRAIAKYIERVFTGLPPNHSALLTHHLKRLKDTGLLVMVKKSYMLPGSDFTVANSDSTAAVAAPPPPTNPHPDGSAVPNTSAPGPKRSRGRPPKPKPNSTQSDLISSSQPNAAAAPPPLNPQSVTVPVGLSHSTQSNITDPSVPAPTQPPAAENNVPNPAPASQSGKRGRGRPKKAPGQTVAQPAVNSSGKRRGRPPKSVSLGAKRSPGRPRKPKSVAANGVKKSPKRLPKSVVVPYAAGGVIPKPRGRPRKGVVLAAPAAGAQVKRPGRPPKVGARPVGRPKKSESQTQPDAYGELKRKFEIFQSRVEQAVKLLKPTLNSETAITAIAAIQDLEEIATWDLNAPVREEAPLSQPQQQQEQPPLQAQPLPQ